MSETDTGLETISPRLDGSVNELAVRLIPTAAVLAAAVTIAWSDVPWLARDEALLTLFYAGALLVPLTTLRTHLEQAGALALVVLALGVLAIMTAVKLRFGAAPLRAYDDGRLDFPVTYVNGDAAFFLVGFW